MNKYTYVVLACISLGIGVVFYAYLQEWIVICWPGARTSSVSMIHPGSKKKVTFSYWHNGTWRQEMQEVIISTHKSELLHAIMNGWLVVTEEEGISDKKVSLQTVLLSSNDTYAYFSFDRNPLPSECSTFYIWMWVEGVLKTLRENGIHLQGVYFLVQHQPLQDEHLDFSNPWPLTGFIKSNS